MQPEPKSTNKVPKINTEPAPSQRSLERLGKTMQNQQKAERTKKMQDIEEGKGGAQNHQSAQVEELETGDCAGKRPRQSWKNPIARKRYSAGLRCKSS